MGVCPRSTRSCNNSHHARTHLHTAVQAGRRSQVEAFPPAATQDWFSSVVTLTACRLPAYVATTARPSAASAGEPRKIESAAKVHTSLPLPSPCSTCSCPSNDAANKFAEAVLTEGAPSKVPLSTTRQSWQQVVRASWGRGPRAHHQPCNYNRGEWPRQNQAARDTTRTTWAYLDTGRGRHGVHSSTSRADEQGACHSE